jgi:hypothetical protein
MTGGLMPISLGNKIESTASSQGSVQKEKIELNSTFVSETVEWLQKGTESGKEVVFTKVFYLAMSDKNPTSC